MQSAKRNAGGIGRPYKSYDEMIVWAREQQVEVEVETRGAGPQQYTPRRKVATLGATMRSRVQAMDGQTSICQRIEQPDRMMRSWTYAKRPSRRGNQPQKQLHQRWRRRRRPERGTGLCRGRGDTPRAHEQGTQQQLQPRQRVGALGVTTGSRVQAREG